MKPDIITHFMFRGQRVDADWCDITSTELPDIPWKQVYIVGNLGGKVPLVVYPDGAVNLPGGQVEPGESVEQTVVREAEEELNMRVTSWRPLGYQATRVGDTFMGNQLRVYATLEQIGPFTHDPGGNVIANRFIKLTELEQTIHYGETGTRLEQLAAPYFEEAHE